MTYSNISYVLTQWTLTRREFAFIGGGDQYRLHQTVSGIFDEPCQFEISSKNNTVNILIKSTTNVKYPHKLGKFATKDVTINVTNNMAFKLKCNLHATKRIKSIKRHGDDIPYIGYSQIAEWISKKSTDLGFEVLSLIVGATNQTHIQKPNHEYSIYWHSVETVVNVTNAELFKNTILNGIGRSRKFGYGFVKMFTIS